MAKPLAKHLPRKWPWLAPGRFGGGWAGSSVAFAGSTRTGDCCQDGMRKALGEQPALLPAHAGVTLAARKTLIRVAGQ